MNDLLDKLNEYKSIVNYHLFYILENGQRLVFKWKQTDFPHLIGLHKLIDIPIIRQFNDVNNRTVSAKYLLSKIRKQSFLTETDVKNSIYYPSISDRYQNFSLVCLHLIFPPVHQTSPQYQAARIPLMSSCICFILSKVPPVSLPLQYPALNTLQSYQLAVPHPATF